MIGPAMDRGGLKDSENAPNSVFSKINESPFWRFGTDMLYWSFVSLVSKMGKKGILPYFDHFWT